MSQISDLCREAHETAKEKGWHDKEVLVSDFIANTHAEVSETFEEYRAGRPLTEIRMDEKGKPEGIPVEIADYFIRGFDFCELNGIDLNCAIALKMEYNKTRPYRHGGKIV